ncbi:hypothetical protein COM33_15495 [Bacillus toyonensis]|uniref:hypothetical protein n=1 Tax=Bacillus TaxID=1386 RepID=UPI0007782FD3|nr:MULTISPECIES: hypothetical protein [Bacillus]KXY20090.1 hypothetical protein AT259_15425 [Bacillus cereus]MDH8705471.1 UDP-N-acetylglucosamine transferase subunit ALG13 [Stenotrophomonas sp. 1198]MDP9749168.1 UDP-N-acetylglucosamine transferase subunit ALG13 [Bacillus thuringiensis]MDF9888622.1 UDP-N-acetylglucosamine transferase subunit ALG13 [Bacillus sp. LEw-kw-24]MDH6559098.1 UDP-N-acetylglucosamine transferase subunit ALG13 [Bacillus sp. LEw-kw-2]
MKTNTIGVSKLDGLMQEIDGLVSNYRDLISKLTGGGAIVDVITAGGFYMVYLRSKQYSNKLFFDVIEVE